MTRKISDGVAKIKLGLVDHIFLGNLDSRRDWGYSPDYVEAMWRMLQEDDPDDYVISTGESYSIRDFLDLASAEIGIEDWSPYVKQDPRYLRPAEVDCLRGDNKKARETLGWSPSVKVPELVKRMVRNDLDEN